MPNFSLALTALLLLLGHCLADFFQGGLSKAKRRQPMLKDGVPGPIKPASQWLPWLALHGLLHGAATGLALMSWEACACEAISHALIDWGKCEGKYGTAVDQTLHIGCKVAWLAIFFQA